MKYKETLMKLLHGIATDNRLEIDEACHTFLAITGIVSVEDDERKLAERLSFSAYLPHCEHGRNGLCSVCDAKQTPAIYNVVEVDGEVTPPIG